MADKTAKTQHKPMENKSSDTSLSNGQNAGNADKMGISGVALWHLTLKWL